MLPGGPINLNSKTEIIAFCSGKGGTGKSLLCSCLGYALIRGGQRVLMIDGDPATDGLSLFLLGPKGMDQVESFSEQSTFVGALNRYKQSGDASLEPRPIHRRGDDHGVTYNVIISGRAIYGDSAFMGQVVPDLDQALFRSAVQHLFDQVRGLEEYDYVLIDTRGGFAFESADICALADSFIVITEPDVTSFYQDRNLVARIGAAARDLKSPSLLRAMIVNKAVDSVPQPNVSYLDTLEVSFRNELVREFGIKYKDTHPIPVSLETLMAYKIQKIPYISTPDSRFCFATLAAFSNILQTVTSCWSIEQVDKWNELVRTVSDAIEAKRRVEEALEKARIEEQSAVERLREEHRDRQRTIEALTREATVSLEAQRVQYEEKIASLEREMTRQSLLYEREYARSQSLMDSSFPQRPSAVTSESHVLERAEAKVGRFGRLGFRWVFGLLLLIVLVFGLALLLKRTSSPVASSTVSSTVGTKSSDAATAAPATAASATQAATAVLSNSVPVNKFAVIFARGRDLTAVNPGGPSAVYEAQLAIKSGLVSTAIYERSGYYYVVSIFDTEVEASTHLLSIRNLRDGRWAPFASTVDMAKWCPITVSLESITVNAVVIPVSSCDQGAIRLPR